MTVCPMFVPGAPPIPHVGGPIIPPCCPTVITGNMPQARVSDISMCAAGGPASIVTGAWTVLVGGQPAARISDTTSHGGKIVTGFPTVLIGTKGAGPAPTHSGGAGAPGAGGHPASATQGPGSGGQNPALAGKDAAVSAPDIASSLKDPAFAGKFEEITGLSMQQAMDLYKSNAGEDISPQTIETLFSDSAQAKQLLMNDKKMHTQFRDILNSNIPATEQAAIDAGYKKLPWYKSMFHSPDYGLNPLKDRNAKYVSADGHMEAVYNPQGGLVSDNEYKGTFNFFGPDQAGAHWEADVEPYQKWGN